MTNEELLSTGPVSGGRLLTTIDQQKRFILQQAAKKPPCPNCGTPVSEFEAMGVAVNDYSFDGGEKKYTCPHCQRELRHIVPVFTPTGWFWTLVPVEVKP